MISEKGIGAFSKSTWFIGLFWASSVAEIGSILLGMDGVHQMAKPLLMLSLLLYFLSESEGYPPWRTRVVGALCFSWLGDILLMRDDLFIMGLGSFLVAHIFYIAAYLKVGAAQGSLRVLDMVKIGAIGGILISVLYPHLGDMLIPVVAYALVLLLMALSAHKRRGATNPLSFLLVSLGAMLFVVSDALIAIGKFAFEVPHERLFVMITYIAAQYLIVQGVLKHDFRVFSDSSSRESVQV